MSDDDAAPTTTTNCRVEARNNLNLQPVRQTIVYGEWSRRDEREVHGFILPLYYRANTSSSIASYQCNNSFSFSQLLDSPSGLELMIPADVIEMEDNALGLRLEEAASIENITISVQTAVLRCMYWKEDVEMWWDHGCTVENQSQLFLKLLLVAVFVAKLFGLTANLTKRFISVCVLMSPARGAATARRCSLSV